METKQSNLATIKRLYELFAQKDRNAIKDLMDDEIVWQQMEGFPNGGTYIGKEAIFEKVFGTFNSQWKNWKAPIREYVDAGDCIIALGHYEGTYLNTDKFMKAEFAHFYYLGNGKIKKFVQYADTNLIAGAMGLMADKKEL